MTALTPGTTTGDTDQRLLRVAVPNKGSLSESATEMLRESGYRQRSDSKQLTLVDAENGVEFFYLRPRDIALYVGEGTLDVGVTGRDLLADSGAKAEEALQLSFGRSRFHFAGPAGRFSDVADLAGMRIATSYVGVVRAFLEERGIEATVVRLDGAVETTSRASLWTAARAARDDDRWFDGAVEGLAAQLRRLGRLARRPQTGQLHQYYIQAVAVLAIGVLLLVTVR